MKSAYNPLGIAPTLVLALLLMPPFLSSQSRGAATPNADTAAISSLESRWLQAIQSADIATGADPGGIEGW